MPDPKDVLEREAEAALAQEVERIRAAVREAGDAVLSEIGATARPALQAAVRKPSPRKRSSRASMSNRITRTDASREFGVTMSRLRTMERHGVITPRRKGGRIMLDRDEVAAALAAEAAQESGTGTTE